jgi:hypothetical protein
VLADNHFVANSSTAISRRDADGNTYQQRRLADGTQHKVLKKFPTGAELEIALAPRTQQLSVTEFVYYWGACYRIASTA